MPIIDDMSHDRSFSNFFCLISFFFGKLGHKNSKESFRLNFLFSPDSNARIFDTDRVISSSPIGSECQLTPSSMLTLFNNCPVENNQKDPDDDHQSSEAAALCVS